MAINYTEHSSNVRTIRQDDPEFFFNDGFTVTARAGVEFDTKCPKYEMDTIRRAFSLGYVKLVAHVKDNELVWEHLSQ